MMSEMVAHQQQLSSASFSTPSNGGSNNNISNNGVISHASFSSTSSGAAVNGSATTGAATADAEAREWWAQREAKVERELYSGLQKRMDAQRKQVLAFKTEQTKWENKLQVCALQVSE